jgi:signal transduction histidine kinase
MSGENWGKDADPLRSLPRDKLLAATVAQYKNSVLGTLVKGIVHNLNGSLQILSMRLEMLQRLLGQEKGDPLRSAREQADQGLKQIDQFRGMIEVLMKKGIHDETEGSQLIQPQDLLEESLALLHHNLFFKHHIQVKKEFVPALPPCRAPYTDLGLAVWILLQNAVEAMETSPVKTLTLETGTDGDRVRLLVRDTGCGIPPEIQRRLFEPFLTTKKGKHPGLGLFIARSVLREIGAELAFSSREGETAFTIYLPTSVGRGN